MKKNMVSFVTRHSFISEFAYKGQRTKANAVLLDDESLFKIKDNLSIYPI